MKIHDFIHLRGLAWDYLRREVKPVICWDPEERARAVELLGPVGELFRRDMLEARAPVVLIYLYRQSEQNSLEFCHDGICNIDGLATVRENERTGAAYSVIAVAVETLHCPNAEEYAPFVFLHELAHIVGPSTKGRHNMKFHTCLDSLIDRYNKATGSRIENDYCP